jgi:hypothetical protein
MISTDRELVNAVALVNDRLQQIQNYLGDNNPDIGRVKIPKGYIRPVKHFKDRLHFVSDNSIKTNLAYALVQSDVYLWVINRMDLYGVAREMTLKFAIALIGSISETLAVAGTDGIIGKRHSFCKRCDRMVELQIISDQLRKNLQWLWEIRSGIHIYDIGHTEYKKYNLKDFNRAVKAGRKFMDSLEVFHEKRNSL